jgi:exonuclease III
MACWNADGVRRRKQELDHFLGQHGIDICLLAETHLKAGKSSGWQTMIVTATTG